MLLAADGCGAGALILPPVHFQIGTVRPDGVLIVQRDTRQILYRDPHCIAEKRIGLCSLDGRMKSFIDSYQKIINSCCVGCGKRYDNNDNDKARSNAPAVG